MLTTGYGVDNRRLRSPMLALSDGHGVGMTDVVPAYIREALLILFAESVIL